MNARSILALPVLSAVLILGSGCAHEATTPSHAAIQTTVARPAQNSTTAQNVNTSNMSVSGDIAQICKSISTM